jgi:restriction system protein
MSTIISRTNKMARKKLISNLPTFDELLVPTVQAIIELGGSGTVEEINAKVYEIYNLTDNIIAIPHGDKGTTNEVDTTDEWKENLLNMLYGITPSAFSTGKN